MEDGAPLFSWLEINKKFGVEESGGVSTVVGAPGLAGALRDFGERTQDNPCLIGNADAFVRAGAGGEGTADPERTLVQVGQKFRAERAAEGEIHGDGNANQRNADRDSAMANGPAHC